MSSKQHAIELMNFAHGLLNKAIDTVPADKATFQTHATCNHVLWTLGHLASTYNWLSTTIDPTGATTPKLPETYKALFTGECKPTADPSRYPPLAEVRKNYDAAFGAFLKLVEGLKESDLWTKPASDTGGFCSSKIDAAYKCAWHDGWHLGQVTDIRRTLALPSIF
jgi:hypothetical protein